MIERKDLLQFKGDNWRSTRYKSLEVCIRFPGCSPVDESDVSNLVLYLERIGWQ